MLKKFTVIENINVFKKELSDNNVLDDLYELKSVLFLIIRRLMKVSGIAESSDKNIINLDPWDDELKDQICGMDLTVPATSMLGVVPKGILWKLNGMCTDLDGMNARGYFRDDTSDDNLSMDILFNDENQLVFSSNTAQGLVFSGKGDTFPDFIKHVEHYHFEDNPENDDPLYHDYIIDLEKADQEVAILVRLILKRIIVLGILFRVWYRKRISNIMRDISLVKDISFTITDKPVISKYLEVYSHIHDVTEKKRYL
ncbi:hypothetical protein [Proteus mirabilis]|uniref:hypothetical protein n=1 Tax=Proteus mirabilis TaxID=584 RepID=UPI0034D6172F